jgi:hypothetical protein
MWLLSKLRILMQSKLRILLISLILGILLLSQLLMLSQFFPPSMQLLLLLLLLSLFLLLLLLFLPPPLSFLQLLFLLAQLLLIQLPLIIFHVHVVDVKYWQRETKPHCSFVSMYPVPFVEQIAFRSFRYRHLGVLSQSNWYMKAQWPDSV